VSMTPAQPADAAGSRWRFVLPIAIFLALVALFALTLWRINARTLDIHEIRSPLIGRAAPPFTLPSLQDPQRTVTNTRYRGQLYVVNVWGTWCGGCREEHGTLLEVARRSAVPFIGLDWNDDRPAAIAYLAQLGNPYAEVAFDYGGHVAIDFGVYGAPETFLISTDGVVLEKHIGPMTLADWERKFAPRIAQSLPRQRP
jgi:cytochrome c biogenesis protein CcmG, thiol:disulfide interchange protein DsbE